MARRRRDMLVVFSYILAGAGIVFLAINSYIVHQYVILHRFGTSQHVPGSIPLSPPRVQVEPVVNFLRRMESEESLDIDHQDVFIPIRTTASALSSRPLLFVVSTGCTGVQHGQSTVLAASFKRVGQQGELIRIVSGCSAAEEAQVRAWSAMSTPYVQLFFTRDFSTHPYPDRPKVPWYMPYNKPFGLSAWLNATMKSRQHTGREPIVVFLDPDFVFVRPLEINDEQRVIRVVNGSLDAAAVQSNSSFLIYAGKRDVATLSAVVENGRPMAQIWTELEEDHTGLGFPPAASICETCGHVSLSEAREYYMLGPPYLLTLHDLAKMVEDYCALTVARRHMFPDRWIEEMHGYAFAAAKNELKHTIVTNLAAIGRFDVNMDWYDHLQENPCAEEPTSIPATALQPPMVHMTMKMHGMDANGTAWFFYKRYLPDDLFECDAWMLAQPPPSVWDTAFQLAATKKRRVALMNAYGLCVAIKSINAALVDFKQRMCPHGFNTNRKLKLSPTGRPHPVLDIGPRRHGWTAVACTGPKC